MSRSIEQHKTAKRPWPELLFSPAIDAPGRGWRISGFGLLIVALVVILALLKAPAVFGGGAFARRGVESGETRAKEARRPKTGRAIRLNFARCAARHAASLLRQFWLMFFLRSPTAE